MRYRLEADVEGNLILDEDVQVCHKDILVEFLRNEEGMLSSVAVSVQVDSKRFATQVKGIEGARDDEPKLHFIMHRDEDVHDRLVEELQKLECNFGYISWFMLERIRWDNPRDTRIPETEEEEKLCSLANFKMGGVRYEPVKLGKETCENLVTGAEHYEYLTMHKGFAAESFREYKSGRYIQSFCNAFFVLESFYGKGKAGKNMIREFKKSEQLRKAVRFVMGQLSLESVEVTLRAFSDPFGSFRDHGYQENMKKFYEEEGCAQDVGGTIELISKVRGNLHHYYSKSSKRQGTPYNQRGFISIAYFTKHVAAYSIGLKEVEISGILRETGVWTWEEDDEAVGGEDK